MAEIRVKKSSGPQGPAKVSILKHGFRVSFNNGEVYDVEDGFPKGYPAGAYNVSLSSDKSRIVGVRPPSGQYIMRFKQFGNRTVGATPGKPGLPTNKIQPAKMVTRKDNGQQFPIPEQIVFIAQFEVATGQYEGLSVTSTLPYSFTSPAVGDLLDFSDTKRNLNVLEKFFHVCAGDTLSDVRIEYSPEPTTLLLRLEKYLTKKNIEFLGNIGESGFADVNSFSVLPIDLKPKSKAKKGAKK